MKGQVFTPREIADRWKCSERFVRKLIQERQLQAWKLGGKLLRISADAVEEYECENGLSGGSKENAASSTGPKASEGDTVLALQTRARLNRLRQHSMRS